MYVFYTFIFNYPSWVGIIDIFGTSSLDQHFVLSHALKWTPASVSYPCLQRHILLYMSYIQQSGKQFPTILSVSVSQPDKIQK